MPKARKSKNKSGGRETMNATSEIVTHYSKGDQVFAKMAGYPPWPGKIFEVITREGNESLYLLHFYGTYDKATMKSSSLRNFEESADELSKSAKGKLLKSITEAKETPLIIEEKLNELEQKKIKDAEKKAMAETAKVKLSQKRSAPVNNEESCDDGNDSSDSEEEAGDENKFPFDVKDVKICYSSNDLLSSQQKGYEHMKTSTSLVYAELDLQTKAFMGFNNLIFSTTRILGTTIFHKNISTSASFKNTELMLVSSLAKLNPDILWTQDDILFLLRLVASCGSSEQKEILQRIFISAKTEKSPAFLKKVVEEFVLQKNPGKETATTEVLVKKVTDALRDGNLMEIRAAFSGKHPTHMQVQEID